LSDSVFDLSRVFRAKYIERLVYGDFPIHKVPKEPLHIRLDLCPFLVKRPPNPRPSRGVSRSKLHHHREFPVGDSVSLITACSAIVKHADTDMDIVGCKAL
jgi:hypothetical protein